MSPSAAVVCLDGRRQVVIIDPSGAQRPLTAPGLLWASWGHHDPGEVHSWPTWSPDGSRIAAFRIAKSGQDTRVWVSDAGGVRGAEVAAMGDRVPIYIQWSLDGGRLAALSQDSEDLVLQVADPDGNVADRELLRGSPLFFTWVAGQRIAAFVGEGARPRMSIVDPNGPRHDLVGKPSNFCAPVNVELGVAYVAQVRNNVMVMVSSLDGTRVRELEAADGLVAILASPDGRFLARAISPDGSGVPYQQLELLEVSSATSVAIADVPCTAFFWLPDGSGLVVAQSDPDSEVVTWLRVDLDGSVEELWRLIPSRDTRVYLRFFEQYGQSHPIISPQGDQLVLCGTPPGSASGTASRIYLVPLDGSPPETLGEGLFATFRPS